MQFENGASGNITVGRLPYKIPNEDIAIEVTGTEQYAEINHTLLRVYPSGLTFEGVFEPKKLLKKIFLKFIDAMENPDIKPSTTFSDGLILQKLLLM